MRASRLLSILTTLQARGRASARALADEFGVSLRTIYRDVDALSAAGIPIYSERGNLGGYRLLDGYRTRLNGISALEAESLFLSGLPGQVADLGLGATCASAQDKLLAALPAAIRAGAGRMRSRFYLDVPGWFDQSERPACLSRLAEAVWSERPIHIRYRSWTAEKERVLDPLGIVLKGGAWYLVGRTGAIIRTYRVCRILQLELLEGRIDTSEQFDLASYWTDNARRFVQEHHPEQATLRLSPRGLKMMAALLPPFAVAGAAISPPHEDGWCTVSLPVGPFEYAAQDVLRFGAEAQVLAPEQLRQKVMGIVGQLAAAYAVAQPLHTGEAQREAS
ncbi:YafY family transcriptional regulator [Massilia sp. PAMC28688]|uniref:helix-turn-helix transcriptional regulator n=1 Tax=Massilia sp. PAMC28688 TaxID=2861283 RepID=UPI001C62A5C0|nr:YafY family protein [Massilia sp. PAMC28688]QYF92103.1 YafY family transcriptional regulator [Massilia sp. PAMC28688]